jgi:hypothetical protein
VAEGLGVAVYVGALRGVRVRLEFTSARATAWGFFVGVDVGNGEGVAVGGWGVNVGVGEGVAVGGLGVNVDEGEGVAVGGLGVSVDEGEGVAVGGLGVSVDEGEGVAVGEGVGCQAGKGGRLAASDCIGNGVGGQVGNGGRLAARGSGAGGSESEAPTSQMRAPNTAKLRTTRTAMMPTQCFGVRADILPEKILFLVANLPL